MVMMGAAGAAMAGRGSDVGLVYGRHTTEILSAAFRPLAVPVLREQGLEVKFQNTCLAAPPALPAASPS
jgi:hypothetical protein